MFPEHMLLLQRLLEQIIMRKLKGPGQKGNPCMVGLAASLSIDALFRLNKATDLVPYRQTLEQSILGR
jgi:hypothetical protein